MRRLALTDVAAHPNDFRYVVALSPTESTTFRPLLPDDDVRLAAFLAGLSPQTRAFATYPGYDLATAREMCHAIARYDKLRMVATTTGAASRIVACFEFSFDVVAADKQRFAGYGLTLNSATDCRFGPCVADDYQNQGLGSALLPPMVDLARRFGQRRMILWGGVLASNQRAIHFYQKHGFQMLGAFTNSTGEACYDMILVLDSETKE